VPMFLSDFDYELPDKLIARYPAPKRSGSRLLVVGPTLDDRVFSDLPQLLNNDDLLVCNNTRVVRARLVGKKETGGSVEILVERLLENNEVSAQVRASKSPTAGSIIVLPGDCAVTVLSRLDDMFRLRFSAPVTPYLEQHGKIPLPPYLGRGEVPADSERYQTVYARAAGAVAAPTAGLHFDQRLLDEIKRCGVRQAFITLHVGAGTFQPLRHDFVHDNSLHSERCFIEHKVCKAVRTARQSGNRVIAVGTTSVRALEAASINGGLSPYAGETDLFITPGYQFQSVDAILTNFHLPKSSLLMLVAAFGGHRRIMAAYEHAVSKGYRFFSYGDAMLLLPEKV